MKSEVLKSIREVLSNIKQESATSWVYLPADESWSIDSRCAVLQSDEVSPDQEDDPNAGIPDFAKKNNLMQALPVSVIQDIVENATKQQPNAPIPILFKAFLYYFDHDAFIKLKQT